MSLLQKIISVLTFGSFQVVLSKLIALVNFAILVRLLSTEEIGIIGLAVGYVALAGFVLVTPESILIRDFNRVKGKLNQTITSFFQFSLLRNLGLMGIALGIGLYFQSTHSDLRFIYYFILLAASTLIGSLTGPFRESFYASFRQARITFVDLASSLLLLAGMGVLYFSQDVITYGLIQVGVAMVSVVWWMVNARRYLHFRFSPGWDLRPALDALKGFAIWNHLAATVIRLVYQIDIVILGFFVDLKSVGIYAIALTLANVFFVFPQMVQKVLSLTFSQLKRDDDVAHTLGTAIKYNTLFVTAQWIGFLVLGEWIIALFDPEYPTLVFQIGLYLCAGIALFNISRPWIALAVPRLPPRDFFLKLFLPPSVAGVIIYWVAASQYGMIGVAQANVLTLGLMGAWAIVYVQHTLRVKPHPFSVSPTERTFLNTLRQALLKRVFRR